MPDSVECEIRHDLPKIGEDAVRHRNPWAKALFFLAREGVATTWRKIESVRDEGRIVAAQQIVVATFRSAGRTLVGVTRDVGGPLRFDPRLLFETADPDKDVRPETLVLPDAVLRMLETYLPVPSCPFPSSLQRPLLVANPRLQPLESAYGPSSPTLEEVPRPLRATREETSLRRPPLERESGARTGSGVSPVFLMGNGAYVRQAVAPHFEGRVAAALDYRAGLMNEHLRPRYPVTSDYDEVLDGIARAETPQVIVSTYHSDHARMTLDVLAANPDARVFVQKPAAVELSDAKALLRARRRGGWIDVGFNRRYAPMTEWLSHRLENRDGPLTVNMIVKEVKIPPSHWYFWPNQGTRITGNLSHWIDLAYHLVGSSPLQMNLLGSGDDVSLSVKFRDGSLVNVVATDKGDDLRGVEERIEVRSTRETLVIDDFCSARSRSGRKRSKKTKLGRDKGQNAMFARFAECARDRESRPLYPDDALFWTSYMTYHAARMLRRGESSHQVGETGPRFTWPATVH